MSEEKLSIPASLDFSEQDIENVSQKLRIVRDGIYPAVLGGCENSVSKTSHFPMFILNWWPLKDVKDASTVQKNMSMKSYIVVPMRTPDVDRKYSPTELAVQQSKFADMLTNGLRGVFGVEQIPDFPRWNKDEKCYQFQGSTVPSKEDADRIRKDINRAAMTLAQKLWADPNLWTTPNYRGAYLSVEINENGWPNVQKVHGDLPKDGQVVPYDLWFQPNA